MAAQEGPEKVTCDTPLGLVPEAQIEVVHVAPEPAAADAAAIVPAFRDALARGALDQQLGKIDARIDRELQRAPESAVDFHDDIVTRHGSRSEEHTSELQS